MLVQAVASQASSGLATSTLSQETQLITLQEINGGSGVLGLFPHLNAELDTF